MTRGELVVARIRELTSNYSGYVGAGASMTFEQLTAACVAEVLAIFGESANWLIDHVHPTMAGLSGSAVYTKDGKSHHHSTAYGASMRSDSDGPGHTHGIASHEGMQFTGEARMLPCK